ncbi:MAG: histone deacetylase [Candidatus Hydrogenedentota bacterium]
MKIIYSDKHRKHHITGHPESPKRVEALKDYFEKSGYEFTSPTGVDYDILNKVHTPSYVQKVFDLVDRIHESPLQYLDPDTYFVNGSLEAALDALGCAAKSVELSLNNKESSFALTRPPGHHAEADKGMGFCIFNNVAYAAKLAMEKYNIKKILIFDFDVHHGNGTEKIFYDTPAVLYISIHQHPHYPGTGHSYRIGEGEGEGFNINIPLETLSGEEEAFSKLNPFKDFISDYKTELLIFSAGFDAHRMDPLSATVFESSTYKNLTETIIDWAAPTHPAISCLEGGYDIEVLCESALFHIKALQ